MEITGKFNTAEKKFHEEMDGNTNALTNLSRNTEVIAVLNVPVSPGERNNSVVGINNAEYCTDEMLEHSKTNTKEKKGEYIVHSKSPEFIEALEGNDSQDSAKLIIDETHLSDTGVTDALGYGNQQTHGDKHNICDTIDSTLPIIEIYDDDGTESMEVDNNTTNAIKNERETNNNRKSSDSGTAVIDEDVVMNDVDISNQLNKSDDEIKLKQESHAKILSNVNEEESEEDTELYYNKECINHECLQQHKQFLRATVFVVNYYKVNRKKIKAQYVCIDCYHEALDMYEKFCGLLDANQPLLLANIPKVGQEFVEIIDSSDEEEQPLWSTDSSMDENAIGERKFSLNDLNLIENELYNCINYVLNRVNVQSQLTWSKTVLSERLNHLESEFLLEDRAIRYLQRKSDNMFEALYRRPKNIRHLQPLDFNGEQMLHYAITPADLVPDVQPIPPAGEIERLPVQVDGIYYGVKSNVISRWVPCKIVEQAEVYLKNVRHYKIKYLKSQYQTFRTVPAKHLAYYEPPSYRLPIGTRVIAYFDASSLSRGKEKINVQSAFYPGIIAEPLKPNNKFRYLIFYDDGYTQYVYHKDVRLVCHVSENVWEDIHPTSRDFIQKYITQYSINRPMVQAQKGQSMNTQSNGSWLRARVVDIDCSLMLMQFEGARNHTEWIYRGSLRLLPVFKEYQKTLQKAVPGPVSRLPRRTEPFIRYTQDDDSTDQQISHKRQQHHTEGVRSVARKSFGRHDSLTNQVPVKTLNNSTIYVEDESKPKGKVVYYTAKRNLPPQKFRPHQCSPLCLIEIIHNLGAYSPLSKPLLSGWERLIFRQKLKKIITYRGPCGRILRNMKELHYYLRCTENTLNVDNFDFTPETNCLAEYVTSNAIVQKRDISGGQEKIAIPLVNYYDNTLPPECRYSAKVIPTEGVNINTNVEFLVGCDCEDDCSDKMRCSCWQLTLAGAKYGNPSTPIHEVGYQYKRLLAHVPTGIYECNARCKCKSHCLNRVVQHSLQMKLQVFKTSNRGWGLRCVNDIPRGSFICIYAGHLLTEAKANEGGLDAGDEYFAELDYIEVAEQIKEGYESEVETEPGDEVYIPEPEDDDEFTPSTSYMSRLKTKLQNAQQFTEDEFQEREVISFNPNANMNEDSSIRKLFGKNEACYVMDAKITGNLGRYFNHSCSPNLFVQSVFVDTHDLRFPWVAFFSSRHITAGTELTWNYNYEVGSVPGKVLYCQCGADNCRQRLL